jgi:hypothetical protein
MIARQASHLIGKPREANAADAAEPPLNGQMSVGRVPYRDRSVLIH